MPAPEFPDIVPFNAMPIQPPILDYTSPHRAGFSLRLGAGYFILQTLSALQLFAAAALLTIALSNQGWRPLGALILSFGLLLVEMVVGLFSIAYAGHLAGHSLWLRVCFFAPVILAVLISIATIVVALALPGGYGC